MTAVATTAANPPAKIPTTAAEKVAALQAFLGARAKDVEQLLSKASGFTPATFIRTVVFAAQKNAELLSCSRQSIFLAALDAAILGLPVGTSQSLAHLVPFRNKDTKQLEASLIVDFKGIIALMLETGDVAKVELEAVYEKDDFEAIVGAPRPHHRIFHRGPRGAALGYYAVVTLSNGQTKWLFMGRDEVEQVRKTYTSENSPAWRSSYDELAKKVCFKRLAKTMRRTGLAHERMARAIDADNHAEAGLPHEPSREVIEATGEVIELAAPAVRATVDIEVPKASERAREAVAARAAELQGRQAASAPQGA